MRRMYVMYVIWCIPEVAARVYHPEVGGALAQSFLHQRVTISKQLHRELVVGRFEPRHDDVANLLQTRSATHRPTSVAVHLQPVETVLLSSGVTRLPVAVRLERRCQRHRAVKQGVEDDRRWRVDVRRRRRQQTAQVFDVRRPRVVALTTFRQSKSVFRGRFLLHGVRR